MSGLTQVTSDVISTNTISGLISAGFTSMNVASFVTQNINSGSANTLTISANNTSALFINTLGQVIVGGNTAQSTLTVYGTTSPAVTVSKAGDLGAGFQLGRDASTLNAFIIQRENADLFIRTNNTERMRIANTGNIGIGTASPVTRLQVAGTTRIDGNIEANANPFVYSWSGGTTGQVRSGIQFDGTNTLMSFYTATNERMRIDSAGFVGIGCTPVNNLQVNATSDVGVAMSNSNSVTSGNRGTISMFNSSTSTVGYIRFGAVTDNVGTDIQFATRPAAGSITERMRIDSSGNVGIGTSSPAAGVKLDVLGGEIRAGRVDSSSEGGQISFSRSSDNATAWYLDVFGNTSTPSFRVVDVSSGAVRATFDSSGNFQFNSGYGSSAIAYGVRAWVNFDGTGTPAIRASGNVSSITDNGVGNYWINFTNAMPDTNYCVQGGRNWRGICNSDAWETGRVYVLTADTNNNTPSDSIRNFVTVYR
jgi:hypothetical protein